MKAEVDMVRRLIAGLKNPQVAAAAVILVDRAGNQEFFTVADPGTRWLSIDVDVRAPERLAIRGAVGA